MPASISDTSSFAKLSSRMLPSRIRRSLRNCSTEITPAVMYATMGNFTVGRTRYFAFYDEERLHQSLNYQTPDVVYASGKGGGAMIVGKYGRASVKTAAEAVPVVSASSAGEHGGSAPNPALRANWHVRATAHLSIKMLYAILEK